MTNINKKLSNWELLQLEKKYYKDTLVLDYLELKIFKNVINWDDDYYYQYENLNWEIEKSSAIIWPLFLKEVLSQKQYIELEKMFFNTKKLYKNNEKITNSVLQQLYNKIDSANFDFLNIKDVISNNKLVLFNGILFEYFGVLKNKNLFKIKLMDLNWDIFYIKLDSDPYKNPKVLKFISLRKNKKVLLKIKKDEEKKYLKSNYNLWRIRYWWFLNNKSVIYYKQRKEPIIYLNKKWDKIVISWYINNDYFEDIIFRVEELIKKYKDKILKIVISTWLLFSPCWEVNKKINKKNKKDICIIYKNKLRNAIWNIIKKEWIELKII